MIAIKGLGNQSREPQRKTANNRQLSHSLHGYPVLEVYDLPGIVRFNTSPALSYGRSEYQYSTTLRGRDVPAHGAILCERRLMSKLDTVRRLAWIENHQP